MHVHVYLHRRTVDSAAWEENKHPRKDDGKFGGGVGAKKPDNKERIKKAENLMLAGAYAAALKALEGYEYANRAEDARVSKMRLSLKRYATKDAIGKFDESKHKRDGGKFSATQGKSASNAEHSAKAAPHAQAVRTEKNPEKQAAHNEALSAWAEARKHLDPNKPMAEQSEAYKAAVKKAEAASAKANEARQGKPKPAEGKGEKKPNPNTAEKGTSKTKGRSAPAPKGMSSAEALRQLRTLRRGVDPEEHEHDN